MILNCIAVDDEPLALGLVTSYIEQTPFLKMVKKFDNAIDALKFVNQESVDLIFLDIQMNDLTGLELARVIESHISDKRPLIIFTTSYDQFAIESYKVDAVDYLLKPFNYEEFLKASNKAYRIRELHLGNTAQKNVPNEEYLFLKVEYQLVRVNFKDILFIEGLKDYVKVHLAESSKPLLSLTSLKSLEQKLPANKFMRVHRSFIVSLDKIDAITKNSVQIGDNYINVTDNYKHSFMPFFNKWSN